MDWQKVYHMLHIVEMAHRWPTLWPVRDAAMNELNKLNVEEQKAKPEPKPVVEEVPKPEEEKPEGEEVPTLEIPNKLT